MLTEKEREFLKTTLAEYCGDSELAATDFFGGQLVLLTDNVKTGNLYRNTLNSIGCRLSNLLPLNQATERLSLVANIAAVIVDVAPPAAADEQPFDKSERLSQLTEITAYCNAAHLPMIIRLDLDMLDLALGLIEEQPIEFLLSDDPAELLVTIRSCLPMTGDRLHSNSEMIDPVDLKKISEDVERISRALLQLSGPRMVEVSSNGAVSQQDFARELANLSNNTIKYSDQQLATRPVSDAPPGFESKARSVSAEEVRNLIKARRLRDQYFDPGLFADPAWDMLLDLTAARLEDKQVSVSSLCIAANVPPTTALRWIKTMTEKKIFVRRSDELDGRRIFIELSDTSMAAMIGFFAMLRKSMLTLV